MRKLLFFAFILGLPLISSAQSASSFWATLNTLQPGEKIQIIDTHSKRHSGLFASISETSISYTDSGGQKTIPQQDVRSIKLMENKHRLRKTLIFAGIGAGAGAGIGAASVQQTGSIILSVSRGKGAAVGAIIGGGIGAIFGAVLPSHSTLYSLNAP